ncbi:capsular associated protein [Mortierella sp. GBA39]|nr:capsular associated protein [Mortierella sp. GBA39]
MMEAAQYNNRSPLLPTTNALLDTPDLYHSLTVPLLNLVNRTKLISTRCGATTLEPHLLSFLTNDLVGSPPSTTSTTAMTSSINADMLVNTTTTTTEQSAAAGALNKRTRPYRYLFALVLQDSETILPDVLTRTLETISVLGPDNCHLSVVDHASTDATKVMLRMLKEFLDMYNRGDIQMSYSTPSLSSSSMEAVEKRAAEVTERVERGERGQDQDKKHKAKKDSKQKKQYLSYTITTMTARDASVENVARIKDLALDPLLAAASTSEVVVSGGSDTSSAKGEGQEDEGMAFDRIILMDPAVTCAEDLLELVFQSLLQDADVTCGMDLGYYSTADAGEAVGAEADVTATDPGKLQDGVYDSTVTRDMLHQKLHRSFPSSSSSAHTNNQISNDPLTQTRFSKRVPFQVESCWSRAVVLKAASALRVSSVPSGKPVLFAEVAEKQAREEIVEVKEGEGEQCATTHTVRDERDMFCNALWSTTTSPTESSGTETSPPAADATNIVRMVIVPSIQFTNSPKEYALQGRFDSWGLWPKTEKQYRDELETRLIAASHRPLYGYRPSTSSYGYIHRVEEEDSAGGVAEETVEGLKVRLEAVGAVFGVQDIQNAVLAKRDSDLILDWRPRFAMVDAPPGSVDC